MTWRHAAAGGPGPRGGSAVLLAVALVLGPAACTGADPSAGPTTASRDSTFAQLVARLSEPGGFFDSDNLVSNEASYLHVTGALRGLDVAGGAYLGVGPDQNFSYIATVRPEIALIVDIRRDNLLQQLLFKALFEAAETRLEFLSLLLGRAPPSDPDSWVDRPVRDLVEWLDARQADPDAAYQAIEAVASRVQDFGVPLSLEDLTTMRRFHLEFVDHGLDLTFTSFGRAPRASYPTYRQLLLERDLDTRQASYMASEEAYRYVRGLQLEDRIVPVVGDLAGSRALPEIARYLAELGLEVSAVYVSNVEFYLWGDRIYDRFVRNVRILPRNERSVLIRSYFRGAGSHPHAVSGYSSTQLLQRIDDLVELWDDGELRTYRDVVRKGTLPPR